MTTVRIGSFFAIPVTDHDQPALFTWQEFYDFRNHVIRVLRRFASAGPRGEVDITIESGEPEFDKNVIDDPAFFVVDDMYNEHDKLCRIECAPEHIDSNLIRSLMEMVSGFPGWWAVFSLRDSGLRISAESVLKGGRTFLGLRHNRGDF
jgi:hypothetical protein